MILSDSFLKSGIVKISVENLSSLNSIRRRIAFLIDPKLSNDEEIESALNNIHDIINPQSLNSFRLHIVNSLNGDPSFRHDYYTLAQTALEELVGNELVMQRNVNLSIQLPADDSSLLPIHADVLQGDSPFEVVVWIPLVNVSGTKSMFFCDRVPSDEAMKNLSHFKDTDELYAHLGPHCNYIAAKYGECVIFSQNIFHGNNVNATNETRWSMNCRFKSLLSPYSDKKLGEFFTPLKIRPATRLGMAFARG